MSKDIVNYQRIADAFRLALAHREWLTVEERERIIDEVGDALGNNSDDVVLDDDIITVENEQPVNGSVVKTNWVDDGTMLAWVEDGDTTWCETYTFTTKEEVEE